MNSMTSQIVPQAILRIGHLRYFKLLTLNQDEKLLKTKIWNSLVFKKQNEY